MWSTLADEFTQARHNRPNIFQRTVTDNTSFPQRDIETEPFSYGMILEPTEVTQTHAPASPELTESTLDDILRFVDDKTGMFAPLRPKKEIRQYENEHINRQVHKIFKKLLT